MDSLENFCQSSIHIIKLSHSSFWRLKIVIQRWSKSIIWLHIQRGIRIYSKYRMEMILYLKSTPGKYMIHRQKIHGCNTEPKLSYHNSCLMKYPLCSRTKPELDMQALRHFSHKWEKISHDELISVKPKLNQNCLICLEGVQCKRRTVILYISCRVHLKTFKLKL